MKYYTGVLYWQYYDDCNKWAGDSDHFELFGNTYVFQMMENKSNQNSWIFYLSEILRSPVMRGMNSYYF